MAWADLDDVLALAGDIGVTQAQIELAQDMVEVFAGTTEEASTNDLISSTNLRLLSRAVAYQAIFVQAHPDVLTVMDTTSVSQDGLSAEWSHANAHLLAPMAWRCIKRLSWKIAPLKVRRKTPLGFEPYNPNAPRDSAVYDDNVPWEPM